MTRLKWVRGAALAAVLLAVLTALVIALRVGLPAGEEGPAQVEYLIGMSQQTSPSPGGSP
jgi:hypothetical protein